MQLLTLAVALHAQVSHVDMGNGTRAHASGGAWGRGPHAASLITFWNLNSNLNSISKGSQATQTLGLPCDELLLKDHCTPKSRETCYTRCVYAYGSALNFVGAATGGGGPRVEDWHVEDVGVGCVLEPQDLYNAQAQRRLGKTVYY